jgi:putative membrane protein
MKKVFVYGTAVLALSAAPVMAQQTTGTGSSRQGSTATSTQSPSGSSATQSGTQSGSTATRSQSSAADASKSNADHQFVMEAAQGGMAEVELGQLATEKASSDAVKQFGQRMVTDHGKANDELKSLAQSKNIMLPTDIGAKHKATKDKLSKLSGAQFDRAYMQEMLTDHRKDVNEFKKESQSGKDPDVKAWAAKTLPTLQEHLQMAESASRSAVGTSGSSSEGNRTNGGTRGTTGSSPNSGSTGAPGGSSTGTSGSGSSSGGPTNSPGTTTGSSSPR